MTKKEKETPEQLQKELIELLLKRAGLSKKVVVEYALKSWATKNLDLLTKQEFEHYKSIIAGA